MYPGEAQFCTISLRGICGSYRELRSCKVTHLNRFFSGYQFSIAFWGFSFFEVLILVIFACFASFSCFSRFCQFLMNFQCVLVFALFHWIWNSGAFSENDCFDKFHVFATSRSREQTPATSKSIGNHYTEARNSPRHVIKRPVEESKDMQCNENTSICHSGRPNEIAIEKVGVDGVFIENGMS